MQLKSTTKKKILLLLAAGIELGVNRSPLGHIRIYKRLNKEWGEINKEILRRSIHEFYRKKILKFQKNKNGSTTVIITENGKNAAMKYKIENLEIKKPGSWDKKWRVVIFDVPENRRWARDILRSKIKSLGFIELQKSVWIYPYNCKNIIKLITNFFEIEKFVQYMTVSDITNEKEMKLKFNLE